MKTIKILLLWLALYSVQAIAQPQELKVWMDESVSVTADGKTVTELKVYENDPTINYIAFNMVITVPKGVQINKVRSGREYINDIELSDRATTTHAIACNMPEEGMVKIICTSSLNQELYPDDIDGNPLDELFTIRFVADPAAYNGKYAIELSDCWFVKREDGDITANILDHVEYSDFVITGGTDFPGVDLTIPAEQCGTLILPFDSKIPDGMNVYECNGISGDNTLLLNSVPTITANTPYIITGTAGQYHFDGDYKALLESYSTEYMTGVFEEVNAPEGAYVMQNHKSTTGIGFYKVGNATVKVKPYRCYLNALPNGAKMFKFAFDDVTGITETVSDEPAKVDVYSVDGKKIRSNVKWNNALDNLIPGVYIVNDKKIVKE